MSTVIVFLYGSPTRLSLILPRRSQFTDKLRHDRSTGKFLTTTNLRILWRKWNCISLHKPSILVFFFFGSKLRKSFWAPAVYLYVHSPMYLFSYAYKRWECLKFARRWRFSLESSGPWQRAVSRWWALCWTSCRMHIRVCVRVCVCVCMRQEHIYIYIYILTYSMEQSPSSEANWFCS